MQNTDWINKDEYPFKSHFAEANCCDNMHYVDEGQGEVILMIHGTPTWSFLYRHLIKDLSKNHRCIAIDHLGFGLSDKPRKYSYKPEELAKNLRYFIEQLDLKNITLMVHDFGGSIGLAYAIENPENVKRIVLFNTWMWSYKGNKDAEMASKFFGSSIGKFLYKKLNFSPRVMLKMGYGDKKKLTPEIHKQYMQAFPQPEDRNSTWHFAKEIIGSGDWWDRLFSQKEKISKIPTLILWGMKDKFLTPAFLEKWKSIFKNKEVHEFKNAGHFVQEEEKELVGKLVREFLQKKLIINNE
jgi:pimeloyl-ACP methyl ester carboxylesterase